MFDAITTKRPYEPAFPNEKAFEILRRKRGSHFDPRVLDAFFERLDEILLVQQKYQDLENTRLTDG